MIKECINCIHFGEKIDTALCSPCIRDFLRPNFKSKNGISSDNFESISDFFSKMISESEIRQTPQFIDYNYAIKKILRAEQDERKKEVDPKLLKEKIEEIQQELSKEKNKSERQHEAMKSYCRDVIGGCRNCDFDDKYECPLYCHTQL